jgi:catechol 2,3-dioxygenase-like lactoylglutathione lyase family enzyme
VAISLRECHLRRGCGRTEAGRDSQPAGIPPQRAIGGMSMERDYGVAWSIYMPDPDGHLVEITTYEVTRG